MYTGSSPAKDLSRSQVLERLIDYAQIVREIVGLPSLTLALLNFGPSGINYCGLFFPPLCPLHQSHNTSLKFSIVPMSLIFSTVIIYQNTTYM